MVLIIYFCVGLLFIAISIPLIKRKVKINHWYGIRLPETMKSEEVWYEVNEICGKHLLIFGIIICLISILFYCGNFFTPFITTIIFTSALLVGVLIIVIMALMTTNEVSRKINRK